MNLTVYVALEALGCPTFPISDLRPSWGAERNPSKRLLTLGGLPPKLP